MSEITPEFELIDAVEHQKQYPRTFELPDERSRNHLTIGEWAKLMFQFPVNRHPTVERMWVLVTERTASGYVGTLDNTPENIEFMGRGDRVVFEPRHVISIYPDRPDILAVTLEPNEPVA
jgi:uncharacterized protein YegJ (DUF2314 family)